MNIKELQGQTRWITYQLRQKGDTPKLAKVPYDTTSGQDISANRSTNWHTYQAAIKLANAHNKRHEYTMGAVGAVGVGVAMNGDGVICIDIDNCVTPPATRGGAYTIGLQAIAILEQCAPTLIELSVSKKGLHIYGRLNTIQHEREYHIDGATVEVYSKGQFIAWTGNTMYNTLGIGYLQSSELAPLDNVIQWLEEHNTPPQPPAKQGGAMIQDVGPTPRKSPPMSNKRERERAYYATCFNNRLLTAIGMVSGAQDGSKHLARLRAGELLGGAIAAMQSMGYDVMSIDSAVDALYGAQIPSAEGKSKEIKAIEDSITHGMRSPLTFPPPTMGDITPQEILGAVGGSPLHSTPQDGSPLPSVDIDQAAALFSRMARGREQIAQDIEEGREQRLEELITIGGMPLIVAGATILAARPKMRKSWLALHIANCIVSGEPLFNDERFKIAKRGHVIYLDLEQMADTALTRMDAMLTHKDFTGYVTRSMWDELVDEFPYTDPNELARMYIDSVWKERRDSAAPVVMAIIDTVNPLLPTATPKGVDPVTAEYKWYQNWTKWAQERGMAIIFVSHLNKAVSMYDNPADAVPGGARLAGAVDIFTLTSDNRGDKKGGSMGEQNTTDVVLRGQLRNGAIEPTLLKFIEEGTYHHVTDNSTERQRIDWSQIRQDIGRAIDNGHSRQSEICRYLDGVHASGTIRKTLRAMARQGHLIEIGRGEYANATGYPYHKGNK